MDIFSRKLNWGRPLIAKTAQETNEISPSPSNQLRYLWDRHNLSDRSRFSSLEEELNQASENNHGDHPGWTSQR